MPRTSTNHRIILQAADGTIAVDAPIQHISEDPEALAAHVARLEAAGYVVLKADAVGDDLPSSRPGQSRKLRNAWRWTGTQVDVDLPAARAHLLAEVRAERNRRLDASDKGLLRAQDVEPQAVPAWRAHRQALRDLPAAAAVELGAIETAPGLEAWAIAWPQEPS